MDTPAPAGLGRTSLAAVALGCVLLTALFTVALFPYEQFRLPLRHALGQASGAQVELGSLRGGLGITGPALRAEAVRLSWPDRAPLALEQVRVRAAWSWSWLRGQPAIHVDLRGAPGRLRGTLWPGSLAFAGRLEMPEASRLRELWPALDFASGALEADLDLTRSTAGPLPLRGEIALEGRAGSVAVPGVPVPAIPYERLEADLLLPEGDVWEVRELELDGPLLAFQARGRIAPMGRSDGGEALDLEIAIAHMDPSFQGMLASLGLPPGADRFHLGGDLSRPILR